MPQILSQVGGAVGGSGGGSTGGLGSLLGLGSTAYNLYNQYQQQQYQNKLRDLAQNPAKFMQFAQGFEQPLSAGLLQGVNNQTQAYLGSRGLSESPQISQAIENQAIAPYIQQQQNQAVQDAYNALGLGGGAISPATQQQNSQQSLAQILARLQGGNTQNPNQVFDTGSLQAPIQLGDGFSFDYTPTPVSPASMDTTVGLQDAYQPTYRG
jgi:hypothetical protein